MATISLCDWSGCKVAGSVRPSKNAPGELQRVNGPVVVPPRPAPRNEGVGEKGCRVNQPRSMRVLFTVCDEHVGNANDWLARHRTVQGAFADIDAAQLAGDAPADDGNGGEES